MTPPQQKEWTFEPFDVGMGETEYNVFYGGVFFAKVDNRADVAALIHAMKQTNESHPAAPKYTKHVSEDGTERYNNTPAAPSECYKKGYADAVANALSQHADCVKCLEEDRVTMLEHDATIRNQTLDNILKFVCTYEDFIGLDNIDGFEIYGVKSVNLKEHIESLRHQGTEAPK